MHCIASRGEINDYMQICTHYHLYPQFARICIFAKCRSVLHRSFNPIDVVWCFSNAQLLFHMKEASVCATVLRLALRGSPASTCCSADILAVGWSRAHGYVCRRVCSCSRQQCTRLTLMLWTLLFLARASPPVSLRRINNSTLLSPSVLSSWVYGLPLTMCTRACTGFF